ncbi:HAL/PAL/TAL family ammonia-lyase [Roseococcus sp. YIM B11640]|uniref:HAL/PAL/TAL family ammonia-lyase n=1 Tax=Roseococcus sp. YIM B11640 TaxID=3133973 RepID=UPI003C7AA063
MEPIAGEGLDCATLGRIAGGASAAFTPAARARIAEGEARLAALIADGTPIYGVTTGFGALDGAKVPPEANQALQRNLLRSHAAGVGAPMPEGEVRAMLALRANVLATGITGASLEAAEALLAMLNAGIVPEIPVQGSVGACGDLAPLAHLVLPLIGEGHAMLGGERMTGAEAMARAGLAQIPMTGRDGIALINGTEQTTAIGCLAWLEGDGLIRWAEAIAALSLEALGGLNDAFDERVALAKPHPGQIEASRRLRELTQGSVSVLAPRASRLRDALTLRNIPQVVGAARDAGAFCRRVLEIEINAANDNPLFGLADGFVTSNSGNFHGQAAAEALDFFANALTSLAVISERRCARLVDPATNNGLPAFLIHPDATPGRNSGFMIAQYTAASLVAELRMRSIPAAIQSVPTCANTEDHVPMAPLAARRCAFAAETLRHILAIELLLAAQALDIRGHAPAPALRPAYAALREAVPAMREDRVMSAQIAGSAAVLRDMPAP